MAEINRLTRANQGTLDQLNALLRQLAPTTFMTRAQLADIIKRKRVELWVAWEEENIVGMGTLAVYASPTGKKAHIEDIVVNESHRGQGLGGIVMQKLIERAKFHKVEHVDLTSRPNRTAANKLYQKLGFNVRDTNVYRLRL